MDVAPIPSITSCEEETQEKPSQDISESLKIEQDKKIYFLYITIKENSIIFNISEEGLLSIINYTKKLTLEEIKEIHKAFYGLNSCNEFLDYIKVLIENKKLTIKQNDEIFIISLEVLYLFKKSIVEITLDPEKINSEKVVKDIIKELSIIKEQITKINNENIEKTNKDEINKLKEEINNLQNIKEENKKLYKEIQKLNEEIKGIKDLSDKNKELEEEIKKLKEEIKDINLSQKNKIILDKNEEENKKNKEKEEKEEINKILLENNNMKLEINKIAKILEPIRIQVYGIYNKTFLMKIKEFEIIKNEIEKKLNKKVKGLDKLYQASIDGGDSSIFHSKCDNIPNNLTIICTPMGRRFGGFTAESWDTSGKFKDDKKSFLFSLDKQKIYSYKGNGKAIYCHKDYGPTFGTGYTIKIGGNAIWEKKLYTYEFYPDGCSYNFNGDTAALSESGKGGASYIYANEYEVYKVLFYDVSSDFILI